MKRKQKTLEDLFPDPELRQRVKDQLYSGQSLFGEGSVFTEMVAALVNASLEGEMDHFLEEQKSQSKGKGKRNRRNGHGVKTVRSSTGELTIQPPRDRHSDYNPILIGKRERELKTGLEDVILSLYARGQSVEDIRRQLWQIYGLEMSSGAISAVTDRVWDQILSWQQRTLDPCYVVVYLDAVHFRVRQEGKVVSRAVYTVYGINAEGQRDVLGLYLDDAEGVRHWGLILEDLKHRGVETILFFCVDGLKGFKQVIEQVFPESIVQRCIVHMIRTSTRFVSDKDRKKLCSDLRKIYTSANRNQAETALTAFGAKWDKKYKQIRPKWEAEWESLMAFMDYGAHIRRMIYTTNPVEAIHRIMRKVTKSKGAWINDKGLIKQLYLTLKYNEKSWKRKAFHWNAIQQELIDKFGERYSGYLSD